LLYEHALQGLQGSSGVMPAKGGRADLPDDLVKAAVDQMIGMTPQ
jgi:cytochrome c5